MAQKTFVDGDVLTASDVNTYLMGEGGAWTSYTPTVTQSGSVTVTNTRSRYARYGRTIIFVTKLTVTGSGTGSNAVVVSLPVTAAASSAAAGSGWLLDTSTNVNHAGIIFLDSTTTFGLVPTSTSSGLSLLGVQAFTAGLASGDIIYASGIYEAAS